MNVGSPDTIQTMTECHMPQSVTKQAFHRMRFTETELPRSGLESLACINAVWTRPRRAALPRQIREGSRVKRVFRDHAYFLQALMPFKDSEGSLDGPMASSLYHSSDT